MRRRKSGEYKDTYSSWTKTTKGWQYGRKVHLTLDVKNRLILNWIVTTASIHDSALAKIQIDRISGYKYFLADSSYDSGVIYSYLLSCSTMIPVIDTNKRKNFSLKKQKQARWVGIMLRELHKDRYKKRWEIERTNNILEDYFKLEYCWYVRNRNYDTVVAIAVLAYNLCVMYNTLIGRSSRKVADIVGCY